MDSILGLPDWLGTAGLWLGLAISLLVFSAILGDHWFARLGQYILVGGALGYAAAITLRALYVMPIWRALADEPAGNGWQFVPLFLAILLFIAGLEQIIFPSKPGARQGRFRQLIRGAGAVPVALLIGAGIAVAALGLFQGTLGPQFLRAAQIGLPFSEPLDVFLGGLLTLLITSGVIVHFAIDPVQHLADQPRIAQRILRGWIWIGQRAIWLAAGVIFARLAVSRISLLIAQFAYWQATIASIGIWQAAESWWQTVMGG